MEILELLSQPHDMNSGSAAPFLEVFTARMASVGHTPLTISFYLSSAIHFGGWLEAGGLDCTDVNEETIKAFGAHRCKCPGRRSHEGVSRSYTARVQRFADYLREQSIIAPIARLEGVRGRKPVNLAELERLLVRFSYLVIEQSWIKEIDINPLLASSERLLALDARVVLHARDVLNPPAPAIRPYPVQYVKPWRFEDGAEVPIRPIRPEDERSIVRFHAKLSDRSIYQRYFHLVTLDQRASHDRLVRVCFSDYDREIALVAERQNPISRESEIIAVGRLSKAHLMNEAELTVLIVDEFQSRSLGTEISGRLIEIARSENLTRVTVEILGENLQMIEVCRLLGFRLENVQSGVIHGVLAL